MSTVSSNNSTNVPLTNGQTFTGTKDLVDKYASAIVYVAADQGCLVKVQHSADGVNFDIEDSWSIEEASSLQCEVKGRWARTLVTNNSGIDMAMLRVQTLYKSIPQKISLDSTSINATVGDITVVSMPSVSFDGAQPVTFDYNNQSVQVWGFDGATNKQLATDGDGKLMLAGGANINVYGYDGSFNRQLHTDSNGVLSVNFNGTQAVAFDGTQNVAVSGNVSINDGASVNIGSLPGITFDGTPSVSVSGNVSINDGASVNVGSLPSISFDGTQSVSVSGNVTINDGASVSVSSLPNVTITDGSNINVFGLDSGTPRAIAVDTAGKLQTVATLAPNQTIIMQADNSSTMRNVKCNGDGEVFVVLSGDSASLAIGSLPEVVLQAGQSIDIGTMPNVTVNHDVVSMYRNLNLSTTGQVVKNSAGLLCGFSLFNLSGFDHFVKIYNKATAATDSDTPLLTFCVRANDEYSKDFSAPIKFTDGVSIRASQQIADNDTSALGTNDCMVNFLYA